MGKKLEAELESLTQHLLRMSTLVEGMIAKACQALHEHRTDLANAVITAEHEIDDQEVHIEEECLLILAQHQPVAGDLRRTATVMKINSDLERVADLAVNIAERAQHLAAHPEFPIPSAIERMMEMAVRMIRDALDAFARRDVELARDVCKRDDIVDDLNRESIQALTRIMEERPELISEAMHVFSASRHVERIADHATNIAEDVIYLVGGEIARHKHDNSPLVPM